jgi:integrase
MDGQWRQVQRNVRLGSVDELQTRRDAVMALGQLLQRVSYEPRAEAFLLAHDFIEREWKPRVLSTLKSSTQSSYRANLHRYVLPWLQGRRLRDVRRSDVQGWLAALSESSLARQSVKNTWSVLSAVLRTAMDWGYIEDNPARGVRLPPRQPKPRLFLPSPKEIAVILQQLPEPTHSLALLLIATGLRVGEAVGLRWEDIDLATRTLTVRRGVWHGKVNSPKYEASERVVPLGSVLLANLRSRAKEPERWVFETSAGTPVDPHNLAQRQLHPVLERLELPRFSWHRLRKLHSTYMADQGVEPRVLQAQLGHADAAMTLNLYTQVLPESQRRAVEGLERLLFRNVPKLEAKGRVQ